MKIGILYICTGKYDVFWKGFYESAEQYLLPNTEKHYFVFTDSKTIEETDRIHKIFQAQLGWPKDTLMRFHLFLNMEDALSKMDFLFFFNANYTFVKTINEDEILPTENEHFLVGQIHPVAYHLQRKNFNYENNPNSTAYIPNDKGNYYFAGGLIGGNTFAFLKMCQNLKQNIDKDFENKVIAKWHDESHINAYFVTHEPKKIHPGFCYPQGWYLPFEQKTLLLDKNKFGGHAFLRGENKQSSFQFIHAKLFYLKLIVRAGLYKIFGYSFI
ncbi:MAG: family 6 glucosyltransferase [Chitinophagales bacterium]